MRGGAAGKPNFELPRSEARIFNCPRPEVEIPETSVPAAYVFQHFDRYDTSIAIENPATSSSPCENSIRWPPVPRFSR